MNPSSAIVLTLSFFVSSCVLSCTDGIRATRRALKRDGNLDGTEVCPKPLDPAVDGLKSGWAYRDESDTMVLQLTNGGLDCGETLLAPYWSRIEQATYNPERDWKYVVWDRRFRFPGDHYQGEGEYPIGTAHDHPHMSLGLTFQPGRDSYSDYRLRSPETGEEVILHIDEVTENCIVGEIVGEALVPNRHGEKVGVAGHFVAERCE